MDVAFALDLPAPTERKKDWEVRESEKVDLTPEKSRGVRLLFFRW
jgi:hypothetical protein